jgi:hypothetical protein
MATKREHPLSADLPPDVDPGHVDVLLTGRSGRALSADNPTGLMRLNSSSAARRIRCGSGIERRSSPRGDAGAFR